jgi:ABC-type hemin transport system ATPase subunit
VSATPAAVAEESDAALAAENISIRLGSGQDAVQALRGATLRVPRGTLHMLLGPNGCGKVRAREWLHVQCASADAHPLLAALSPRCCASAAACSAPTPAACVLPRRAVLCFRTRTTRL